MREETYGFRTRAVHAGGAPDPTTGARAVPIYQTTSFVFEDTADAADLFALQKFGNIYSRIANPTVAAFEERMASLEGGIGAVATASGQAAEFLTFAALAGAGDHIVASAQLYGGTRTLLDVHAAPASASTRRSWPSADPADFAAAIRPEHEGDLHRGHRQPVGRDRRPRRPRRRGPRRRTSRSSSTARSPRPYLCRPIEHGADIVVHSATKFIGGHGTSIGGVVVESGRFPWDNGRFPLMTEPVASYGGLSWWGNFAEYGFCTRLRAEQLRDIGATLSPFNAFLFLLGLETLALRMDAPRRQRRRRSPSSSPGHPARVVGALRRAARARRTTSGPSATCPKGPGAVFAFGVKGGRAAGRPFIESVELCSHLANVGDARTLVIHPGSHDPPPARRRRARRGGRERRPRAHLGRHRGRRRHLPRPRPGPRQGGEADVSAVDAARPAARAARDPPRHPHGGDRRRIGQPGTPQLLRRHLPAVVEHRLRRVLRQPQRATRSSATRSTRRSPRCPDRPTSSTCSAAPRTCPASPTRPSPPAPDAVAAARAVGPRGRRSSAHDAGLDVVMNRCLKIEHARFHGGLHLAGFDTGVISSKRRPAFAARLAANGTHHHDASVAGAAGRKAVRATHAPTADGPRRRRHGAPRRQAVDHLRAASRR